MARAHILLRVLIWLLAFGLHPALAQQSQKRIVTSMDSDYYGFDLSTVRGISLDQCKVQCLKSLACAAFTYNTSAQFCFLKSDFRTLIPFPGAIAGRIVTTTNAPDLGNPPELKYVPSYFKDGARNFRNALAKQAASNTGLGYGALIATARQNVISGKIKPAVESLTTALKVDGEDSGMWLELSNTATRFRSTVRSERILYQNIASFAAYSAYEKSRTSVTRAAAIAKLAERLTAQRRYRPALTAYRDSLELIEMPRVRKTFENLLKTRGFRVTKHTIDSDASSPRACVQFSEKLEQSGTDFDTFIRLDGKQPQSIDVKSKQICIEGLEHGNNYKLTIRKGLPSSIGEKLHSQINLDIYVRDRQPTVRFTGSKFVLPYSARRGIPLVTINTSSADLKLHRIGERALSQLLSGSQFLKQLSPSSIDYLMDDIGEAVWAASVSIKSVLNREVVTSIPIDVALGQKKPGVYVLSAIPVTPGAGSKKGTATQWFMVSDIGLTTFSSSGNLRVFTRSLASAKPLVNVDVTLIARNNEVLGTAKTDNEGQAVFDAGLSRGKGGLAPAVITAKQGEDDFVLLDISKPGFDFSDRGVTGLPVPKGVDVYSWTERGIYRAGETVHVAALARNPTVEAISNLPLTFIFKRPDGVEDRRIVDNGAGLGGYAVKLPLVKNSARGTWQVQIHTDPKSESVAQVRFLVEDFLPERTDFTLTPQAKSLAIGKAAEVTVDGRFLYGAPAVGLSLAGELIVRTKRDRENFPAYLFGLASEAEGSIQQFPIKNMAPLDEQGKSTFPILVENMRSTTRPQSADLVVRMREGSGRAVERRTSIDLIAQGVMIGVRPEFKDKQVAENSSANFDLIAVEPNGNKTHLPATSWSLVKIERNYQWYRNGSGWRYESVDIESKVANGSLTIDPVSGAKLSVPVKWGRYRLDVEAATADGAATSVEFNAGWFVETQSTETPDGLEIGLDKASYSPGETAKLKVSPRFAGEMLIVIGSDNIVESKMVTIPAEGTTVDLPVSDKWGAGAYVLATLYRPGDAEKSRMPMRAIGVKWLSVDPQNRALQVKLNAPAQQEPRSELSIPVEVTNLQPGEEAYVMVAAVDVGILNLTNYQSPDPVARYFGQRKLGVEMRDIYGRLIDGSLGATGRLRTGGDGIDGMSTHGTAPTEKLVAFFSGPVRLDENGKVVVTFNLPQFNGSVRIMATAWTEKAVGAAQTESIIRDPVVISASLPKFMAPGDESRLLVEINSTDAPTGIYSVEVETSENLVLVGGAVPKSVNLEAQKRSSFVIPVTAKSAGTDWARIRLWQPEGISVENEIAIEIRPGMLPVTNKIEVTLAANGGGLTVDKNLLSASQMAGAKVNISVALASAFDVPSLLLQLDLYPYGCAEQVTSRALPLLYVKDFSGDVPTLVTGDIDKKINKAINSVLAYQSSSGGFSLWGSSSDDLWLGAYVTDFLTRAQEKGYTVPAASMRTALQSLQNTLTYQTNIEENGDAIAYALYVLARNRKASAGDLRYYSDTQLQSFASPIARAQLAAGMALYGDHPRAERTFGSAFRLAKNNVSQPKGRYTYGSSLRDASAMLALASESTPEPADTSAMSKLVASLRKKDTYTSTQEQAWMLLAARAEKEANEAISLSINGAQHEGTYAQKFTGENISADPVSITNLHSTEVKATITMIAVPSDPLPAGGEGFTIERSYFRLDGTKANISDVKQNERFVAVVKIKQLRDLPSRVIVSDLLPAGFEIDNPRLVASADNKKFEWLPKTTVAHLEFRDDRFIAAFNRDKGGNSDFTVAYTVRAVTPGVYVHPAASVEDMYRPQLSARTSTGWMQVRAP